MYVYIYMYMYMYMISYIYICIYVCVCVCMYVCTCNDGILLRQLSQAISGRTAEEEDAMDSQAGAAVAGCRHGMVAQNAWKNGGKNGNTNFGKLWGLGVITRDLGGLPFFFRI